MTLIYSNGSQVVSFKPDQSTGHIFNRQPTASIHQTLDIIQNILQSNNDNQNALPNTKITDICKLLSCYAKLAEDMVWQLRVLDGQGAYLQGYQSQLAQELLFFYTILQQTRRDLQQQINEQTDQYIKAWQNLSQPLKLNLGCGDHALEGWLNVDTSSADLSYNLLWDWPFQDNSVAWAYSSYLLEHLNYPTDALKFLQQIYRILQTGGVLRICVPNIKPFMQAYLNDDEQFFARVEIKWGFSFGNTLLQKVLNYAGVGHKPSVVDDHKFGYDATTLAALLISAGFGKIYSCDYMQSSYPELQVDFNPLLAESYGNTSLSLIYEAVK